MRTIRLTSRAKNRAAKKTIRLGFQMNVGVSSSFIKWCRQGILMCSAVYAVSFPVDSLVGKSHPHSLFNLTVRMHTFGFGGSD